MSDDDPFADLGQTLEGDQETTTSQDLTEPTTTEPGEQSDDPSSEADPMVDPAFSYEAATQRPFYARDETIEDFDAWLNYELERALSTRGYQNIVVREMTDALLRTVVEEDMIDAVAERFEDAREAAISE